MYKDCVYFIFIMRKKCLNNPKIFRYVCDELTKFQRCNLSCFLINVMNSVLGVKWVTKIKVKPPIFVVQRVCEASHGMGKWFAINAFAIPIVYREPKDRSSEYYFRLTNIVWITFKFSHTVKYPDFSPCKAVCPAH